MKRALKILAALVCGCLVFLSLPSSVLADRGMVPIGDTLVYEPGQKAIIGWDGEHEILILATDVHASSNTMVLEIFPLPSQPERIEKGDFQSFVRIGELIEEHFPQRSWLGKHAGTMGEGERPGVEIVFHEKIGAHDIWVAKANDAGEFAKWAEDFLARNGIDYEIFPMEQRPEDFVTIGPGRIVSPLEAVVWDYIEEGINFFVFDLIEISSAEKSVEPIVYQFKTDFLYYPLKISSIIPGATTISLFLLTPKPLDLSQLSESQLGVMEVARANEKPIQFKLDEEELQSIEPRLNELLGEHAWLTALESHDPRNPYISSTPLALLDEDVKLTKASLAEEISKDAYRIFGSVILGVIVLVGMGTLFYLRYRKSP